MESLFYNWSKNGNKMIINSEFKEFNKQTNYISTGNVIANTQYSNYIRPYTQTINPVGDTVPEGQLFEYDLKYFNISSNYKNYIKSLNRPIVLYEFFIYRNGAKDIIGWLIEDNGKITEDMICGRNYGINYNKRCSALVTARNILEENLNRRK